MLSECEKTDSVANGIFWICLFAYCTFQRTRMTQRGEEDFSQLELNDTRILVETGLLRDKVVTRKERKRTQFSLVEALDSLECVSALPCRLDRKIPSFYQELLSRCAAPLISLCVCARESAQDFTERALVIGYVCRFFLYPFFF
jgi:hypothetical protein